MTTQTSNLITLQTREPTNAREANARVAEIREVLANLDRNHAQYDEFTVQADTLASMVNRGIF